ncbi:hypothetical protein [Streptomyces sp. NPDC048551]|uniref:hypothetical protein n=1 Tax=Streptomyces sp. NPDC048551 TaxID=3155758 RepID=UPI003427AEF1
MFLKPIYEDGLHIRGATVSEFAMLRERHAIPAEKAPYTWMLERDGHSFVVGGHPHWREAEYELMGERQPLYDPHAPWPPEFPAESGSVY